MKTIRAIIEDLPNVESLELSLFRVNKTRDLVKASTFALSIAKNHLDAYLKEVSEVNLKVLSEFESDVEYEGEDGDGKIQWKAIQSPLVKQVCAAINDAKACVESEWIASFKWKGVNSKGNKHKGVDPKGVVLKFAYNGNDVEIFFDTPVLRSLKSLMFSLDNNKFKIIDGPVLVLPLKIDAIRINDRVYFLTKRGLNMFVSPEAVATNAEDVVLKMLKTDVFTSSEAFAEFAKMGHNPQRLLRYDQERFNRVLQLRGGKKIREKFRLKMADGKIVINEEADATKLIKVVCSRGMVDPFTDNAMEVSGAENWK